MSEQRHIEGSTMADTEGSRHIHRRLTAFQKLLEHAVAKFSSKPIYDFLKMTTETFLRSRGKQDTDRMTNVFKIRSIVQLRNTIEELLSNGLLNSDESEKVVKHFDMLLRQLDYLKNMKKYFDTKIFKCLCNFFYDPYDEYELSVRPTNWKSRSFDMSGEPLKTRLPVLENRPGKKTLPLEVDEKSDKDRFSRTVSELRDIDRKWERLLREEALNLNDFDPESHHDLIQFDSDCAQFEPILRLVPDIHAKCKKAMQLANIWIVLAKRIYKEIPVQRTGVGDTDIKREAIIVERHLFEADEAINRNENQIDYYHKEMENVSLRNLRFAQLSRSLKKIKIRSAKLKTLYEKVLSERQTLAHQMHLLKHGSRQYMEQREKLAEVDKSILARRQEMKLVQHELFLLQGDCAIEENSQSDMNEYVGYLKNKIKETKLSLEEWQRQKVLLGKKLVLLKTNTEENRQNLVSANPETITRKKSFSRQNKTVKQLTADSGFLSADDTGNDLGIIDLDVLSPRRTHASKKTINRAGVLKHSPSKLPTLQKAYTSAR